ncbi:hypothetical protein MesoLj113a_64950 [Mesorhizobium sp. 113-1-2]|nr:hypothetical protein MLTONO_6083 [Mesorhizobium loti]BCG75337.1 hypothetical protein MesoLj113a_64950 [Mesorhizobium sp. 113-1-2]
MLTPKDKQKALDTAKEIGDKVRVEEITPKPKKRWNITRRKKLVRRQRFQRLSKSRDP